ncbi:hypothetical protein DM860_015515 [Cuscuta australis]|uniref:Secreted protein n=1 Tax=Cuscuta australis TaxID=267555 RepID=A0A328DLC8_9ASTE|nr:hypothetical protein DM860_015515 [Cuscuta australis]
MVLAVVVKIEAVGLLLGPMVAVMGADRVHKSKGQWPKPLGWPRTNAHTYGYPSASWARDLGLLLAEPPHPSVSASLVSGNLLRRFHSLSAITLATEALHLSRCLCISPGEKRNDEATVPDPTREQE